MLDDNGTNIIWTLCQHGHVIKNSEYILIVCGDPKKEGYRKISIEGPKEIFIFGKHAKEIESCVEHPKKLVYDSLEDLLRLIKGENNYKNILFSPGYPSGDDFSSFIERGEYFNFLVKKYLNEYK